MAFDIVLLQSGRVTWDTRHRGWRVAGEIGTGLGLLWGGNWKSLKDLPHFEMRGQLTLRDCRSHYAAGLRANADGLEANAAGLRAVWAKLV
jgi:peptidoglycan L-alanyl-D-glutamate endopeptidase CwlK